MNIARLLCLLVINFLLLCAVGAAQHTHSYGNDGSGKEFWIAIPSNDKKGADTNSQLEIYVTSAYDTDVTIEYPATGMRYTQRVEPGRATVFSSTNGTMSWDWEIGASESVETKGIRVVAGKPVTVSVLSSKRYSADGFVAIPTDLWGTEYRHLCFYDFKEDSDWGSGFIVVAKDDNTSVVVRLQGVSYGGAVATTKGGRKLGESFSVTLQRGQTYMVMGDGKTQGVFDLSGTRITANKPIGLLSFHQRTMVPSRIDTNNNGRDCLSEMMTPVSAWSREYVSVELNRDTNNGDFFRVMAAEDNTSFRCEYTDFQTEKTYVWEGLLPRAGDFAEKETTWPPVPAIRGRAVWKADKPIMVMQYAYSAEWDDRINWDPMMMRVIPVEQFTRSAVVAVPPVPAFQDQYISIVALGDTADAQHTALKSLSINGVPVYTLDTAFTSTRVPNTPYYIARLHVLPGASTLQGHVSFAASLYGSGELCSYGWAAAERFNKRSGRDTLAPRMTVTGECAVFTAVVVEDQGLPVNLNAPVQTDAGISRIALDEDKSFNVALMYLTDPTAVHIEPRREKFAVRLSVVNPELPAFGLLYAVDRAGNVSLDSVRYTPSVVVADQRAVSFGLLRAGSSTAATVVVTNPLDHALTVRAIELSNGSAFRSVTSVSLPVSLAAYASMTVRVEYTAPGVPYSEQRDTLVAVLDCGRSALTALDVRSGAAAVRAVDYSFPDVVVGEKKCTRFVVKNEGPFPLVVAYVAVPGGDFTVEGPTPPLPLTIEAFQQVEIQSLCFQPQSEQSYKSVVVVEGYVENDKSDIVRDTAVVAGRGYKPASSVGEWSSGAIALQGAPNPGAEYVQLRYTLPASGRIRVELFSATGVSVGVYCDEWQQEGSHSIGLNTDSLAPGVYLCRLETPWGATSIPLTIVP